MPLVTLTLAVGGCCRPNDDDDDDFGGGFEMELANMDDSEAIIGEGPETQQTCVKWVSKLLPEPMR